MCEECVICAEFVQSVWCMKSVFCAECLRCEECVVVCAECVICEECVVCAECVMCAEFVQSVWCVKSVHCVKSVVPGVRGVRWCVAHSVRNVLTSLSPGTAWQDTRQLCIQGRGQLHSNHTKVGRMWHSGHGGHYGAGLKYQTSTDTTVHHQSKVPSKKFHSLNL